ncbi:1,6-anhydro-N-acetylmuramyl-L-alanine amidase AmpD [Rheinheimera sp. MMS21-TC3]|uniref:1,6-anhydro-N-acetylmuramyl-L-alanine amidase AmpD n=1 Tax=Rheinheimera sp. MMS21-TC3 TaxID=3072790 RepID=UPI0028C435A9|nr:1,6-anhydro-N-acetylmuramyl-L-alanine amidase AmpD [Rheinheimera sp. MMS21-TC3]WNO60358.1 1,6-anhydro-N-acetylmuramyl-L-alanine amidase AmpD [Rheinheimera sp. MMS21-TC3]
MNSFTDTNTTRPVFRQSPHFDARPANTEISLLVIHNISLPAGQFAANPEQHAYVDDLFMGVLDPKADASFVDLAGVKVSAHCVIWRDGRVFQYVPFAKRAWHAGISQFAGRERCNDFSIGIELEGTDNLPYTDSQYQSLIMLTQQIMQFYPAITLERIVGHSDIAPGRKTDPGPAFDWARFQTAIKEFTL